MKNFKKNRKVLQGNRGLLTRFLYAAFCCIQMLFALNAYGQQTLTVSGTVTDAQGQPLPGATVVEEGTTNGTITNNDGVYMINVPENATLVFSFVGMGTQRVAVNSRSQINIRMEEEAIGLEEVVAIGYGTQSRRTLTTAIAKVDAEKIEDVPVTSVTTALQGKVAGVRIYQAGGGQPGSDAAIRIRGGSSINKSNEPLFIIDGVERNLNDINPNDIETVQVLKDASSTAIYGSRASNGVVLVTTKKGKTGKAEITFSSNTGIATPWKTMDMVGAEDYLTLVRTAAERSKFNKDLENTYPFSHGNGLDSPFSTRYLEDGESVPEGYKSMVDPLNPDKTLIFQDNDFQDLTFNPALEQIYNLSANGGSANIKYAASLGYSDIKGTSVGTYYNRFTGRANVDFLLRDNLKLTTHMDHSTSKTNRYPQQDDIFNRSIWLAPTAKVYMDDGSYGYGFNRTFTNPLWYNDVHKVQNFAYRTGVGANITWNISSNLKAEISGDYFIRNTTFEHFEKANVYRSNRNSVFNYDQSKHVQFEGVMTYYKTFEEVHNVNFVAGVSELWFENFSGNSEAEGGSTDLIWTLNAAPLKLNASTNRSDDALLGIFGRLTYDYNQKYLLGLSLRRDESSRFAKENRAGYFPSASAGWIVTEESFMQSLPVVNTLKLRASYGQTGNNSVGRYDYAGVYQVGNNYFHMAGILPTEMPNPDLKWETTTQIDVGFDLGLFKNDRLNILFDYYEKVTSDLLFSVPLPNESGFNNINQNIGKVKFYGYEFDMRANIIKRNKFSWEADFNIGYTMNRVLKLPDNGREKNRIGGVNYPEGGGIGGIAEGERMNSITGYLSAGILDTWEEANNANWDANAAGWSPLDGKIVKGRKIPGDMEWTDRNGDKIIDEYDKVVLGYSVPTTTGGFSNSLSFGNFEFNVFMDYALGHSIPDEVVRRSYGNLISGATTPLKDVLTDVWQQEGDVAAGKAKLPRFDIMDNKQQSNYGRTSDLSVYNGDYLCLRELRLSYQLPGALTAALHINSARITLAAQNLYYFTAYPGWTPEYSSAGGNYTDNTYPIPRKIMLGLKVGF